MRVASARGVDLHREGRMASRRTIERQDLLKGLRAASATVVPFFLAWQWQLPNLSWAALAGWLTCLADTGGSRSRRALTMLGFGAIGAVLLGVGG